VTELSLFSGIGGFSLAARMVWENHRPLLFCEIDPFCRKVLELDWPDIPIHHDIRTLDAKAYEGRVDLLTGGFPCQDISFAGRGDGIAGERSGLWREMRRIICEVRPRYVVVENVTALAHRGLGTVLGDLAGLGYDAEWESIPACVVGSPQRRWRLFIVAYPHGEDGGPQRNVFTATRFRSPRRHDVDGLDLVERGPWSSLPDVRRVDYGIPGTMDRLRALGNAVVPQVVERIYRGIVATESQPA
jgi:DNA (cytosine-5)-methyltransferase 1